MAKSTLLLAFEEIEKQFNACSKKGDYNSKLRPLLHKDVIISKVDDLKPPTAFATVDVVIQYLEQNQTDKFPKFNHLNEEETPSDSSNSTLAQVSGLATYKDTPDANGLTVRYFFNFAREMPNDASPWRLIVASAATVPSADNEIRDRPEPQPIPAKPEPLVAYNKARQALDEAYSDLTFDQALYVRGLQYTIISAISLTWLVSRMVYAIAQVAPRLAAIVLPVGYAASPPSATGTPPPSFTPPLGIPQGMYDVLVFMFAIVLVVIILALVWAGYFAKPKSTKAAAAVEHSSTFLLGALFRTAIK